MMFVKRHLWLITGLILLSLLSGAAVLGQDVTPLPESGAEALAEGLVDATQSAAEGTVVMLDGFISALTQPPQSDIARILLIIGGVLLLVAGWRIYEFIVTIAGAIIGAMIALSLIATDSAVISVLVMLIGGAIGALLGIFLYYVAVFVIGAYVGIVLTGTIAAALALTPVSSIALLIGGLIGGIIMLGISTEFLIFLAAVVGAQMLALGLGLGPEWTLIFAIVGIVVQFVLIRSFNYPLRRRPRRAIWRRRAV